MTAGTCSGTVTVTYNNGTSANATVQIPVMVNISATALITVTPDFAFGYFTATSGSATTLKSHISVSSTDGSELRFSSTASTPPGDPVAWLSLANGSGITQHNIEVDILPEGLPMGVYTGSITITADNSANLPGGSFTLPVVLTVSANTTVSVTPTSLSFMQPQNATTLPASQPISLIAAGGSTPYTATIVSTTGGNWLHLSSVNGTAADGVVSIINASVNPNSLSPGNYSSTVTLSFTNSATPPIPIPVTLMVTSAQTVTVSQTSLSFNYQLGGATPANQTLNVTSVGGAVGITTSMTGSWFTVTPASGTTGASGAPLVLTVAVVPSALTIAQTYTGTITITPTGQSPIPIPVSITVTGVVPPQLSTIANAGSGAFGTIAPGELIDIKGTNLGPTTAASFTVGAGNTLNSTLNGVQVLFDGIPGTPIYVSPTQINAIVPYEIAGRAVTNVVVSYLNQLSASIPQNVANQAPGIFTWSANGSGQASVLNQNYTYNGPSIGLVENGANITTSPAAAGQFIVVYMTGGGQTNPPSVTGTVTPSAVGSPLYAIPLSSITATINGVNAPVIWAGASPGEVNGVIQVDITVPAGVHGNALPVAITVNGVPSPSGPTVAVQ